MRIPVWLGWLLLVLCVFTAGLLRQFHDQTPSSPFVPTVVGSLLFAAIFFLLLVSAREWRRGAVRGRGVRLGSITPILLMLLLEKWISQTFYVPLFNWIHPGVGDPALADAQFRTLAGVGLILVCLLIAPLSLPTARKTWRRGYPGRIPLATLAGVAVVAGTYLIAALIVALADVPLVLRWPPRGRLLLWILVGQAILAFGEELYYRGLLLSEIERLAPRLKARAPALRRWVALILTSVMFGMEHVALDRPSGETIREFVFTMALGLLFGLLVMMSANLHFTAGIHAWINWLLLGAAPYFINGEGNPILPPGIYIGCTLLLAFALAVVVKNLRRMGHLPFARGGA